MAAHPWEGLVYECKLGGLWMEAGVGCMLLLL